MKLRKFVGGLFGAIVAVAILTVANPQAAHGGDFTVTMAQYAFAPATVTVHVGDTVTWTNTDQAPHDVTTTSGPAALKSPTLHKGDRWSNTFTVAGTYSYICSIHPDMRATVVVTATTPTSAAAPVHQTSVVASAAGAAPTRTAMPPAIERMAPAMSTPVRPPSSPTTHGASKPAADKKPAAAAAHVPATQAIAAQPSATLRPLLLLAGLVTAVAVFCLLLLGGRPRGSSA